MTLQHRHPRPSCRFADRPGRTTARCAAPLRALIVLASLASAAVPARASEPDAAAPPASEPTARCDGVLSHSLRPLAGSDSAPLCERFAGRVLLVVNTASKCGFTPQFEGLDALHDRYASQGFSVVGFPSDSFRQELADEADVAAFCELNYGVGFPMFQKITVTGDAAHPLYRDLAASGAGFPNWNFNKYLIDREGRVIDRYGSTELPLGRHLTGAIEALL